MNVADSELVSSMLIGAGYTETKNINDADAIFVNTCAIREHAEDKVHSRLGYYHKIKKETFHILYGSLNLKLNGKLIYLKPKDIITIEPGVNHEFSSKSGCIFEEISTNHKVSDSYYTDSKINNNKNRKTFVKFWR